MRRFIFEKERGALVDVSPSFGGTSEDWKADVGCLYKRGTKEQQLQSQLREQLASGDFPVPPSIASIAWGFRGSVSEMCSSGVRAC